MATIGTFTAKDGKYTGKIQTLGAQRERHLPARSTGMTTPIFWSLMATLSTISG